ncbi:S16 family serine protease [uncultured Shewanella sp.]|uniref:S16 family serine protease n=1 Tax=uncultured Shewanella sp. TaxID=173975 RepID=UPI002616F1E7|nr:S16 family serine protease [uncultured Shewanella sp.]
MNSTAIPANALSPQFTIPTIAGHTTDKQEHNEQARLQTNSLDIDNTSLFEDMSALLLGQERTLDAFSLLSKIPEQHMYIADNEGISRLPFIKALVSHAQQHLSQSQHQDEPNPHASQPYQDNIDDFCYLAGNIKRIDLIGTGQQHKQSSQKGVLSQYKYVFICAESLLKQERLWDLLMHILSEREYKTNQSLPAIPLTAKVILIGNASLYSHAWIEERLFSTHFPLLGELIHEMDRSVYNEQDYLKWLMAIASTHNVKLAQSSLLPLFNYASKMADHQQRFTLLSNFIAQVLAQAKAYSKTEAITDKDVEHAIYQFNQRHNASAQLSAQNFDDKFINVSTDARLIGQINGLTVLDTVEYRYGEPARITASVHYGDGEVADIERKSELGGNIHAKGMMILSACLYRIFGRDAPLHLNANIVFEQSYQEIDGDSASLAEYCCLISAISEQAIFQGIAATGAIDQFGNVQAIGGVNEKIEGFFDLCERRGLTGEQGVIIPTANCQQLNLKPTIIKAVEQQQFHIYQIEHIDEAVELLMNKTAGKADEDHHFPEGSLYGLVQTRLDRLAGYPEEEKSLFGKLLEKLRIF